MNHHSSALEVLESRIAPAAVYIDSSTLSFSFAGGVLKITPALVNSSVDIRVEQLPDGDFLISDNIGDADLEETASFTGTISSINVTTGTGDDTIDFVFGGPTGFRGSVAVSSSTGDDSISISDGLLRGPLTIAAKGAADITLGSLGGDLDVKGAVKVTQGGGNFLLTQETTVGSLSATGASDLELLGSVIGTATLTSTSTTPGTFAVGGDLAAPAAFIGGSLTVKGGTGDDALNLRHATIGGSVSVSLANGANEITADSGTDISGIVALITGTGDDFVHLSGLTAHDALTVSVGAGTNTAILDGGTSVHGLAKIIGGAANDTVVASNVSIYTGLTVSLSNGTNSFDSETASVSGPASITGGTGDDTLNIANFAVHGNLTLSLGNGANSADLHNLAAFGTLKVSGGTGTDHVSLTDSIVHGGLTVAAGNAANDTTIDDTTVHGVTNISGGADADTVSLGGLLAGGPLTVSLGNGTNTATVATDTTVLGTAKFTGGTGDDTVTFGGLLGSGPIFHGRVTVSLGTAATTNAFTANSATFGAGLSYAGGLAADSVTLSSDVVLYSNLVLSLSGGANTTNIATFGNASAFTYSGGTGVDTLTLGGLGAGYLVGSVSLGAGADVFTIDPGAGSFFASLTVDGGADTDSRSVPAGVIADGIVLKSFETII